MSERKYRLLDLFCGAGGSAVGYHRAGFEVVGVDHLPQKHFPFEFHEGDALEYLRDHGQEFDMIHASPPCQMYSVLRHLPWLRDKVYWDSIPPTRKALLEVGVPWVIENVEFAPLTGIMLCGTMFGLPIYRHRRFEASHLLMQPDHAKHRNVIRAGRMLGNRAQQHILTRELYGRGHGKDGYSRLNEWGKSGVAGHHVGIALKREAMGIPWMTGKELSQTVPPAYTLHIGLQLKAVIDRRAIQQ